MELNYPGIKIQASIQEQTEHGEFNDALYYTLEEWTALDEATLKNKKKERVDNWKQIIVDARNIVQPDVLPDVGA